jgi:hypothetical protein
VEYVIYVFFSMFILLLNFFLDVFVSWIIKWCWINEPIYLFLDKLVKTSPFLLGIVNVGELPEAFLHLHVQKWIPEIQYVHGDQVEVNEV